MAQSERRTPISLRRSRTDVVSVPSTCLVNLTVSLGYVTSLRGPAVVEHLPPCRPHPTLRERIGDRVRLRSIATIRRAHRVLHPVPPLAERDIELLGHARSRGEH